MRHLARLLASGDGRRAGLGPRWAAVVDAATLGLALVALSVDLLGPVHIQGWFPVSIRSSVQPWLAAFAVSAVRHALVRTPSLPIRLWAATAAVRHSGAAMVFLTTRVPPLLIGYLAVVMIGFPPDLDFRVADRERTNLMARWDAGWYLGIAVDGYRPVTDASEQQNIAFFPAYPMLMRSLAVVVAAGRVRGLKSFDGLAAFWTDRAGWSGDVEQFRQVVLIAGMVIAWSAFVAAAWFLYRLARVDLPDEAARGAVLLLGAYPFAVFFSAVYTESLYLLATVATVYYFRCGRLRRAAGWGLLVGLVRPNGFFLSLPLALAACGRLRRGGDRGVGGSTPAAPDAETDRSRRMACARALMVAAVPTCGTLLYSLYVYGLTGRPFAWLEAHGAWGRHYQGIGTLLTERYDYLTAHGARWYVESMPLDVVNLLPLVLVLAVIWPVTRRFGILYGSFLAVSVVPPLLAGGLLSMGRFTSVLFPVFLYLAAVTDPHQRARLAAGFGVMQGFVAVMFFTWRPLY